MKTKGHLFSALATGDFFLVNGEVLRKVNHGVTQKPDCPQDEPFNTMHMETGTLIFIRATEEVQRVKATLTVESH